MIKIKNWNIEFGIEWENWIIGIMFPTEFKYFIIYLFPLYILIHKEDGYNKLIK